MKKIVLLLGTFSLLASCQCKCKPMQVAPQSAKQPTQSTEKMPAPSASLPIEKEAHPAAQKEAQAPALAHSDTAISHPEKTPAMLPSSSPEISVFDPAQARKLIAQARASQTLAHPPADIPAFKKETLLPTEGRLLSPLAYEPIVADNTHAPWSNESLKYGIYYSFVKAGTAYIKTRGLTTINGKKAYLIQTTAFSASVIDSVFKVRDINYSWLDANTFHSLGYSQSVREGNYQRDEWITFDNENGRFYGEIKKKEEPKVIAGLLDTEVLDMLSSLYYVRTQPLEIGKDITFDIINREKQYPLVVKVIGKETVKTGAGKFNCWVVEPQFRGEGIFVAKGKSLKVWLTDDKYRMPVKMSVEVFIGSVYAELLAYTRN